MIASISPLDRDRMPPETTMPSTSILTARLLQIPPRPLLRLLLPPLLPSLLQPTPLLLRRVAKATREAKGEVRGRTTARAATKAGQ